MPAPIPVAILGFARADRLALAASLQRNARRTPAYDSVLGVDDARFVIADASQPAVVALLRALGRTGDAVFVGAGAPADGAAHLPGPVDPAKVQRQLDALLARRDGAPAHPVPAPAAPGAAAAHVAHQAPPAPPAQPAQPAQPARPVRPAAPAVLAPPHAPSPWHKARDAARQKREAQRQPLAPARALLVDDSEIALHFLRRQLERYGLQTDFARHSDRALDLLTHHRYGFVFLDLDLGDDSRVDGLTLCHQIRTRLLHPGGQPPMVVMVSAFHDPVYQVRGTLAGAEAHLGKPLDPQALDRLMQRKGLRVSAAAAPTAWPPDPGGD